MIPYLAKRHQASSVSWLDGDVPRIHATATDNDNRHSAIAMETWLAWLPNDAHGFPS
jgi:hypothetical protein